MCGSAKCAGALVMSIRALLEGMSQTRPSYPLSLPMLSPVPVMGCCQDQHGGQCWTLRALCGGGREGPHAGPGSAGTQMKRRCVSLAVAAALLAEALQPVAWRRQEQCCCACLAAGGRRPALRSAWLHQLIGRTSLARERLLHSAPCQCSHPLGPMPVRRPCMLSAAAVPCGRLAIVCIDPGAALSGAWQHRC